MEELNAEAATLKSESSSDDEGSADESDPDKIVATKVKVVFSI